MIPLKKRSSFTLVEALICILIVGGGLSLFLPAIKNTTDVYRNLRMQGTCHYLADEYFATTLLECLSKNASREIENFSQELIVTCESIPYRVTLTIQPEEKDRDEEEKEKFMVIFKVQVAPAMKKNKDGVTRETKLCVALQK